MIRALFPLAIVLSALAVHCIVADDNPKLEVLNVLFRHGDRAPIMKMPIDPFDETKWQYGYGELTDIGKKQQYGLGRYLRETYDSSGVFGDGSDFEKKVYILSSDVDRCLMSAYSNIAGLYSRSGNISDDFTLPYETWRLLPVHSEEEQDDSLLAMHKVCKAVDASTEEVFNSTAVQEINADYADFFLMLSNQTGVPMKDNAFKNFWPIADSMICETKHNNDTPPMDWAMWVNVTCNNNTNIACEDRTVQDILLDMQNLQFEVLYNSTILNKFDGGPLLEDIITKYDEYIAKNRTVTFNMYSAHDSTVSAVLSALKVFDDKAPQYTAAVIMELWSDSTGAKPVYTVKFIYKTGVGSDNETTELHPPGCSTPCTLDEFKALTANYTIKDWDKECENNPPSPTTTSPPTTRPPTPSTTMQPSGTTQAHSSGLSQAEVITIAICVSVVAALALIALIMFFKRRKISNAYVQM